MLSVKTDTNCENSSLSATEGKKDGINDNTKFHFYTWHDQENKIRISSGLDSEALFNLSDFSKKLEIKLSQLSSTNLPITFIGNKSWNSEREHNYMHKVTQAWQSFRLT